MQITWLGHSSIKIKTEKHTIFIDPYAGDESEYTTASIILVSQSSFDHCSIEKIRKISVDETHVIGTAEVARQVFPCTVLRAGEFWSDESIEIAAIRAYENKLGFVIRTEGKTIYYTGDVEYRETLKKINADILIIPTLNARKAAEIANELNPKIAIPIHWGKIGGTKDNAEFFAEMVKGKVLILEEGKELTI